MSGILEKCELDELISSCVWKHSSCCRVVYLMKGHLKHLKGQAYMQDTGQLISHYKLLHVNNFVCVCIQLIVNKLRKGRIKNIHHLLGLSVYTDSSSN